MVDNEHLSAGWKESSSTSLSSAIESLLKARSTIEIRLAMDQINIPEKDGEMDAVDFLPFKDPLKKAIQTTIASMNSLINKQIRRRMNRLLYVLATKVEKAIIDSMKSVSREETKRAPVSIVAKSFVKQQPTDNETNVTEQRIEKEISPDLFKQQLQGLQAVSSTTELQAFLEIFSSNCPGEDETKQKLRETLNKLCNNPSIGNNARIRRRIKRVVDSLEECSNEKTKGSVSHQETSFSILKESAKPIKPLPPAAHKKESLLLEKPLEAWVPIPPEMINQVSQCESASALIEAISTLRPSAGTCKTRRSLKRAIEKVYYIFTVSFPCIYCAHQNVSFSRY